jgi:NADH dehydrogenase FAD-containing subunit
MRVWIHGNVSSLDSHSVTFTRLSSEQADHPIGEAETIDFDYLVYALGASLPSPVDVWGEESSGLQLHGVPMGCKKRGVGYMHQRAETMKRAKSVLVVGGGALGIRTSSIRSFPDKQNWQRT